MSQGHDDKMVHQVLEEKVKGSGRVGKRASKTNFAFHYSSFCTVVLVKLRVAGILQPGIPMNMKRNNIASSEHCG